MDRNICIVCNEPIEKDDDLNCGDYHKHYDKCRSITPPGYRRVDISVVIRRYSQQQS